MLRVSLPAFEVAFSERSDGDLRIGNRTADEPLEVVQARTLTRLGVPGIALPRQVHGNDVVIVHEPIHGYALLDEQADAIATSRSDVGVAVHVGDCLPIAVGGTGGVAMLHAGSASPTASSRLAWRRCASSASRASCAP